MSDTLTFLNYQAHLVSLHSAEEHQFIKDFNGDAPWVGGQRNQGNNWFWSDGTPWDYSSWASGAPDAQTFGMEDCAHVWHSDLGWNDKPCRFLTTFVCKKGKYTLMVNGVLINKSMEGVKVVGQGNIFKKMMGYWNIGFGKKKFFLIALLTLNSKLNLRSSNLSPHVTKHGNSHYDQF